MVLWFSTFKISFIAHFFMNFSIHNIFFIMSWAHLLDHQMKDINYLIN